MENRISPRAIAAMLIAIQRYLQPRQLDIADLFPVIGQDRGTLAGRHIPEAAVVKTGTLNEVSSLAGVLPTRDRGLVWFTIINVGAGDIGNLHDQQDRLLQSLQAAWGQATPVPAVIQSGDRATNPINWLGNASRNQVVWKG
jgi:serine-type D-Ala-D-Ala carboxypeptidase/endopeptidase (penicillin-binding protein 4)